MLAAIGWVLLGNVGRILIVTIAWTRWHVSLLDSWAHDALGLATFLMALGLLVSTDAIYRLIAGEIVRSWKAIVARWQGWQIQNKAIEAAWENLHVTPQETLPGTVEESASSPTPPPSTSVPVAEPRTPTRWPSRSETVLSSWLVPTVYGALAVVLLAWIWPCLAGAFQSRTAPFLDSLQALTTEDLPARSGPFERVDFSSEHRLGSSDFGEYSRLWRYRFGPHRVVVGVDYPFFFWHELTTCYNNIGWTATSRDGKPDGPGVLVEVNLLRPPAKFGLLIFSLIGPDGSPLLDSLPADSVSGVLDRVSIWRPENRQKLRERYISRPNYQVQVIVESDLELTPAERDAVKTFYREVRQQIVERVVHERGKGSR
jgi:hypothetical protein